MTLYDRVPFGRRNKSSPWPPGVSTGRAALRQRRIAVTFTHLAAFRRSALGLLRSQEAGWGGKEMEFSREEGGHPFHVALKKEKRESYPVILQEGPECFYTSVPIYPGHPGPHRRSSVTATSREWMDLA